eukprot:618114-Pleurochrysis_carterae.AAC.1
MATVAVPVLAAPKRLGEKHKKATAAAAMLLASTNTAARLALELLRYELPNGQWCLKGTCHFTHDKVNPGGPCYGDPRWPGPLPDKVLKNKQQVERIKNAREEYAKRSQAANRLICSAMASTLDDLQAVDVNGVGANFTMINASVSGVDENVVDDQGVQTDPSLNYARTHMTTTSVGAVTSGAAGHEENEPKEQLYQHNTVSALHHSRLN